MLLFQCAAALALLVLCTLMPGVMLVRRLRWSALEKLCGAVAVSLILLWLAAWTIYVLAPDSFSALCYVISAICLGLAVVAWRDLRALFASTRVRRALLGFAFLLGWTILVLATIRVYSGGRWGGDWLEHFQRSLFFLHHFPKDTPIFGDYKLPARPPAMNVLAAFFLAQTSDRFEIFQLIFAFLNLLAFLPCCLLLPLLSRPRRFGALPLTGIFATSPIVMQNATYTWTKLLAAFFVLFAVWLYLRAWPRNDSRRMALAFLSLAAGLLVHYSAGPYVAFFALHYLIAVFGKRAGKVKELALIAATSGALLSTWFVWSIAVYGIPATFASNTSVTASQSYQGSAGARIAGNIIDSVVPHFVRGAALVHFFDQPNQTATVRDNVFVTYQNNLILSMGLIGGPVVIWLLVAAFRGQWVRPRERAFWIWFIASTVLVGLTVVGERDMIGSAHLTLLPLELLGLTLLAANFRIHRAVAGLVLAGCALDFTLGVLFHAHVQHWEDTPERRVFNGLVIAGGHFDLAVPGADSLTMSAWWNWLHKHEVAYAERWKHDLENYPPGGPIPRGRPEVTAVLDRFIASDQRLFHGWYQRHGGETTFVGDHFGDSGVTQVLLAMLCAVLLCALWWTLRPRAPRVIPVTSMKPGPRRPRSVNSPKRPPKRP